MRRRSSLPLSAKRVGWSLPCRQESSPALVYVPVGEPLGLVVVEAASTGLGAVASNHGGPTEIVVDGETGALVDPSSPDAVAEGVRRVHASRRAMGEAALERAHRPYSFDAWLERFEAALAAL